MASMNNWLGFSLSPQQSQNPVPHLGFNFDEISGAQISGQACFDLPSADSPLPSLNLPATHFSILEAFKRNPHSQDWNMKEVNMNSFPCSSQNLENQEGPKLENFLGVGVNNFADHPQDQEKICNPRTCELIYQENEPTSHANDDGAGSNNTIALSMIKNWLRNNPAQPHAADAALPTQRVVAGAQTLSLSMSNGSQSSSPLPSDRKLAEGQTVLEVNDCGTCRR